MIERKYDEWVKNGRSKEPQKCQVMVDPEYVLDFVRMIQIYAYDKQR